MEHRIRVCFISGAYPLCCDGIGDYTAKLISSLSRENLEISLITSNEEPIREYIKQNNLPRIFPIIKRWNIFALIAMLKFIAKEKFDIIHLQFPSSRYKRTFSLCFFPFLLRLFLKKKAIVTLHEFSISYPISKFRQILLSLGSSKVIVTDNDDVKHLAGKIIAGKRKICFIPIGSNIDVYECDLREKESFFKKTGLNEQARTIAFFGFIHQNKGIEYLLQAISKVKNDGISVQLLVMSQLNFVSNAYHNKIKQLIESLALDKSIFITGYMASQEVSKFLSFSDICVLPFTDGVTLRRGTLMAALCHGKAIISTRSNYIPSQLVDKENICLISVNNVKELEEAIKLLCIDNELRKKIAEKSEKLSKDFSWDKIAKIHKELYQKTAGNL